MRAPGAYSHLCPGAIESRPRGYIYARMRHIALAAPGAACKFPLKPANSEIYASGAYARPPRIIGRLRQIARCEIIGRFLGTCVRSGAAGRRARPLADSVAHRRRGTAGRRARVDLWPRAFVCRVGCNFRRRPVSCALLLFREDVTDFNVRRIEDCGR